MSALLWRSPISLQGGAHFTSAFTLCLLEESLSDGVGLGRAAELLFEITEDEEGHLLLHQAQGGVRLGWSFLRDSVGKREDMAYC